MYHKFPTFGTIAFLLLYTSETRFPTVLGACTGLGNGGLALYKNEAWS